MSQTKNIFNEVEVASSHLNILHELIDEGYFESDGTPKEELDLKSLNEHIFDNFGREIFFENMSEARDYPKYVKDRLLELIILL